MITARDVVREVCREFGAPRSMAAVLKCTRGTPEVARLRRYAMHVYRSLPNQSNASVGRAFDRDRTTVRHAVARVQAELKAEATLSSNLLRNKLGDAMCRVRVGDI